MTRIFTFLFFLLSTSMHFLFPQFVILLNQAGIGTGFGSAILSMSMIACAILLPITGYLLDLGKTIRVLFAAGMMIAIGLLGYAFVGKYPAIVIAPTLVFFILGTSITYGAARRITEGLVPDQLKFRSVSFTYLVENCGISVSALIAMKWLADYRDLLILLDGLSTFLFCCFLVYASKKIKAHKRPSTRTLLELFRQDKTQVKKSIFIAIATIPVLVVCFLHLSTLQAFFIKHYQTPSEIVGKLFLVNTVAVVVWILFSAYPAVQNLIARNQHKVFVFACSIISLGLLANIFFLGNGGLIFGTLLWSIGEAMLLPIVAIWVLKSFPAELQGFAVGIKDLIFRIALVVAPIMALALNLESPYELGSLIVLLPLVSVFLVFSFGLGIKSRTSIGT